MERFSLYLEKTLYLIGFDLNGKIFTNPGLSRALKILRLTNLVLMGIAFLQAFIYIINSDWNDPVIVDTTLHAIFFNTAFSRILLFMIYIPEIKILINSIDQVYKNELCKIANDNRAALVESMSKIGVKMVYLLSSLPIIVFVSGSIKILVFWIRNEKPSHIFLFRLYFPFDPYDHLLLTHIYTCYVDWLSIFASQISDQLLVLVTTSYIAACFEKLADNIKEIIDKAQNQSPFKTRKELRKCIDIHNQLIEFVDKINKFFKVVILQFSILGPVVIAVLGYRSVNKNLVYTLAIPMVFLEILDVFYAGQKLKENSTKIAEQIANSDIINLDRSIQKDLIFVMRVSQKPQTFASAGLFTFDLGAFTIIAQSAYSYVAILRQIYK